MQFQTQFEKSKS